MIDPRTRLVLLLCVGLLAVTFERVASLLVLMMVSAVPLVLLRADRPWLRRGALAWLAIAWGTMLSQGLFYGERPRVALFELGPLVFWREGLAHGFVQSLRFGALLCAGTAVVASTPPDRLLRALVALRVPFGLAFLAATALRFVPATAQEMLTVRRARARRGQPVYARAPWAWLAVEIALLRPVIARSLRRARALAETLDTRGFDALGARTVRRPLRLGVLDALVLIVAVPVTASLVAMRVAYAAYVADLWWVPAWRPMYAFVRHWL